MKIGIDLRQVALGPTGGAAQHLQALLETLFLLSPDDEFFVFNTLFNRGLLQTDAAHVHFMTLPLKTYYEDLSRQLSNQSIDMLFRGYPTEDIVSFPTSKTIFFLPDIQHEHLPQFFSLAELRTRRMAIHLALTEGGGIATLTHFTRQSFLDYPWTGCPDIFITSPSLYFRRTSPEEETLNPAELELLPKGEYFYFPANLWQHKNHRGLLQAFSLFLQRTHRPIELVLSGHPAGWESLQKEFPNLPVRHVGFVRPAVVKRLMAGASALPFFSLYEGFGMPLLEAFASGTPVICSNTTSLPEVGGNAVLSCDPADVDAISHLMEQILVDQPLRQQLIERGRSRLQLFSWEKSAQNLKQAFVRLYERIQGHPARSPQASFRPRVSIITPSYNQGRFLKRTIDSVLNQTYPDIEYMVMDGGSNDDSVDILRSYGNRFHWVSEPDGGQTDAINKGLKLAHGEILAYLNSDDVIMPDAVEKVVRYFEEHPACDLVYGRASYIDENDKVTGFYNTQEYNFAQLMWDDCICQPATFWRSRITRLIGLFDDSLNYVMDYDYWLRIDRVGGRIEHSHDLLASSRLYPETKTLSAREKIYLEIIKVCQKNGGYVSLNYFIGLWHHRIWEQGTRRALFLRKIPRALSIIGRLHYYWHNRHSSLGSIKRKTSAILAKYNEKIDRGIFRSIHMLMRRAIPRVNRSRLFTGLRSNNNLDPVSCFFILRELPGEEYYLSGIPQADGVVKVLRGQKTIADIPATAGERLRIGFNANAGQVVTIVFPSKGSQSPFLVDETNLFSEQDLPTYA